MFSGTGDNMALSQRELEILLEKLRKKYDDYGEKYSKKFFNINSFEERLHITLRNRLNLEGFILAEIATFEKLKEKYEKKKKGNSFAQKVDRIIEDNLARIKKYPPVMFHKKAGVEISHFYGAVSAFSEYLFPVLWLVVTEEAHKRRLQKIDDALNFLAAPRGAKYPKRIEDHVLILSRRDIKEIEIEKDKNRYLTEMAEVLFEIDDFCDVLIELRDPEWENPLRFDKLYYEGKKKKKIIENFTNFTYYGAIFKIKENAGEIIDDFRLGAFKNLGRDNSLR